ncbi:hypothetical protein BPNPMPFG_002466 [Mesorhizobium sp. AR07]|uniref:hypothetical protein n=1 Tax=Mesorhizobium sp. AR07 TaxID=2865838 RepID=UPI00215E88C0|nr:hypothetical protein [Mesorhizobium sp. AR07]UVK46758.1 hypothetical protein BPNPMPFG_002466 [Mesorhizobium sp. AR07]
MSIETAIAENTAAIHALIASNASLLALRTDAFEKVNAAVGKAAAAKDKPAPAADKKSDETAATTTNGAISTEPENRVNPYEGIKDMIADYLGEIDRPEEREARKGKIKELLNHPKIKKDGVASATKADDIREDAIDLFKKNVAGLKAKGAITEPAAKKEESDDLV